MPRKVNWMTEASLFITITGFTLFLIVVLAMCKHKQPGSFIVESHLGTSGWSDGTGWVLGITNALYAFGGTDAGERDSWIYIYI